MRIVLSDFISSDGVVQTPGGQGRTMTADFAHGGWSMPYFEPETMGPPSPSCWPAPRRCCSAGARGKP